MDDDNDVLNPELKEILKIQNGLISKTQEVKSLLNDAIQLVNEAVKNPDDNNIVFNKACEEVCKILKENIGSEQIYSLILKNEFFSSSVVECYITFAPRGILVNLCRMLQYLSCGPTDFVNAFFAGYSWEKLKQRIDSPEGVFEFSLTMREGHKERLKESEIARIKISLLSVLCNLLKEDFFSFDQTGEILAELKDWAQNSAGEYIPYILTTLGVLTEQLISHCTVLDPDDPEEEVSEKDANQESSIREGLADIPSIVNDIINPADKLRFLSCLQLFQQYTMLHEYNDEVNKFILNIIAFIEENREGLKKDEDSDENDVSVLSNTVFMIAKIFRNMCLSEEGRANLNCFVPWDDVFDFCVNSDCDDTMNSILQIWCEILYRQELYIAENGNGVSISLAMDSLYIKLLDCFMSCTQIGVKKFSVSTVYNRLQRESGSGEFIMKLLADNFFENSGDIALVNGETAENYVDVLFIVLKYIYETKQKSEVFQEVMKSCETLNEIVEEAEDDEDFQAAAEKCYEIFAFIEQTKDE